jgi:hypothetical protein
VLHVTLYLLIFDLGTLPKKFFILHQYVAQFEEL